MSNILEILNERAKELRCLDAMEELLKDKYATPGLIFTQLLDIIPGGWQHSTICEVRIIYQNMEYKRSDFEETEWMQFADLIIDNNISGKIQVYYTQFIKNHHNESQFIPEEQKLLNAIANRLGKYLFYQKLEKTIKLLNSPLENDKDKSNLNMILGPNSDEHWKWRYEMAEKVAKKIDLKRFGVKAIYLIGSTKNADAGPASDIDLMLHLESQEMKKSELIAWMEGWSLCLAEINFIKTGYMVNEGLIDLHLITDQDIEQNDSFASMIGSVNNSARLLRN